MTLEKAIDELKCFIAICSLNENYLLGQAIFMAIEALKEVQQYREMDNKLREAYGDCDGLLEMAVDGLCKHSGIDIGSPKKSRLLTDEDVDRWDAYKKIGTVEECQEARDKQIPKALVKWADGTLHCPNCEKDNTCMGFGFCTGCGQAILQEDEHD